jgi:MFS family permease
MAGILLYFLIGTHTAAYFFWFAASYQFFMEMGLCGSTIYVPEVYPLHIRVLGASTAMGLGRIGGAIGSAVIGTFLGAGMMNYSWLVLGTASFIAGFSTIWLGIEPKGQNLEQLNKEGTEGAAKARKQLALGA